MLGHCRSISVGMKSGIKVPRGGAIELDMSLSPGHSIGCWETILAALSMRQTLSTVWKVDEKMHRYDGVI